MMIPIPLLTVAGLAFVILLWLLLRRRGGRDLTAPPTVLRPRIAAPTMALPPELEAEVRSLYAERRQIDAIKRVREETGLGLLEAKDLVEAIGQGGTQI